MADDADIRAFLDGAPRETTFDELAAACRQLFGERAWSRAAIADYLRRTRGRRRGMQPWYEHDGEVRAFVDERLGRLSIPKIRAACEATFGRARTPSKSAIHRYLDLLNSGMLDPGDRK